MVSVLKPWPIPLMVLTFYIGRETQILHNYCQSMHVTKKFDLLCQGNLRTIYLIINFFNGNRLSNGGMAALSTNGAASLLAALRELLEVIACKVVNQFESTRESYNKYGAN